MLYILNFLSRSFPINKNGLISINNIPDSKVNSIHNASLFSFSEDSSSDCKLVLIKVIKNKVRCMQKKRRKRVYCRVNSISRTGVFKIV